MLSNALSGNLTLLNFAAFCKMTSASFLRPFESSHRGYSGTILDIEKFGAKKKTRDYTMQK